MKRLSLIAVLFLLLFFTGCIPLSLYPIYTDEDIFFDPGLLGVWIDPDEWNTYEFSKFDDTSYHLVTKDYDGNTGYSIAHLVNIEDRMFLDLYPMKSEQEKYRCDLDHVLPIHSFFLIEQIHPDLKVTPMDTDWLRDHLKMNPGAIKHEIIDDALVFTAPTEELQEFLIEVIENDSALLETDTFERISESML